MGAEIAKSLGDEPVVVPPSGDLSEPGPRRELTPRAIIVGLFVAAFVGASYPYVVLKIGFGPNISVVSAFFGYLALSMLGFIGSLFGRGRPGNRFENNIVQTAGTAAGQAGFMCVLLAAFDMLAQKPGLGFALQPTPLQIFLWLTISGCLGVLLAVPLRRHYIDEEKLTFADGVAAGETLLVLDQNGSQAKRRVMALAGGGLFSALVTWFRDGWPRIIPESTRFGEALGKLNVGISWSALSFGSGLLVGLRITLSMAVGMVLSWVLLPFYLADQGIISEASYTQTLRWVMWPATGMMVAGGLTALVLKWKLIAKTFQELRGADVSKGGDFPIRWVVVGSIVLAIALIALQKISMGIDVWLSAFAILISIPLMLVGTRVLGETNWAPVSAMANMVQAVFAVLAPGSVPVNMVASGMSGSVAAAGEHLMQDYKAGQIVGSSNRALTWMQLIATPVGAIAVASVYPLLKRQYGIGPERYGLSPELASNGGAGLSSPISVKWAGFAELLSSGIGNLPAYALHALVGAVFLGIAITLLETKYKKYLPSPTGIGLGMLIPGLYLVPMILGGLTQWVWKRLDSKSEGEFNTPLASGLIVGEALLALIIPLLVYFGLLAAGGGGGH